jgi:hypothetical protein
MIVGRVAWHCAAEVMPFDRGREDLSRVSKTDQARGVARLVWAAIVSRIAIPVLGLVNVLAQGAPRPPERGARPGWPLCPNGASLAPSRSPADPQNKGIAIDSRSGPDRGQTLLAHRGAGADAHGLLDTGGEVGEAAGRLARGRVGGPR